MSYTFIMGIRDHSHKKSLLEVSDTAKVSLYFYNRMCEGEIREINLPTQIIGPEMKDCGSEFKLALLAVTSGRSNTSIITVEAVKVC